MQPGEKFVRCLLDQKDEASRRARRLRRATLLLSILIQALVLTLLLLRPLFGAQEIRLVARLIPLPPYRGRPAGPPPESSKPQPPRSHHAALPARPVIWLPAPNRPLDAAEDIAPDIGPAVSGPSAEGPGDPNGLISMPGILGDRRPVPLPPPSPAEPVKSKPRYVPSEVQEARVIERVLPLYPPLARQMHLQGVVEIRAIIAADGTTESAEIVSGNALLAHAALDAVLRWRYRPTLLNGRPVEVETIIRVIFRIP